MNEDMKPWNHSRGSSSGKVIGLFTAEVSGQEMIVHDEIHLIAGVGVEGDRYAKQEGRWSDRPKPEHQLTLIESETLDAIAHETGVILTPRECRRNIVTRGIDLNSLIGRHVRIGRDAIVYLKIHNHPCRYLERLIDKTVMESLLGRSGVNCEIRTGGHVGLGDIISLEAGL